MSRRDYIFGMRRVTRLLSTVSQCVTHGYTVRKVQSSTEYVV